MSFELSILGWKSDGLRCPDHSVSFEKKDNTVFPISFVQMPNGTGKTTTLELIRMAITGAADKNKLDKSKVIAFKKANSDLETGKFELNLLFNDKRTTIILHFDFLEGVINYVTSSAGIGQQAGFKPPTDLQLLLRPDFANFIVIDGELPERFLKKDYADAQAIIEHLFQVNLLGKLGSWAEQYWESQTTGLSVKSVSGLTGKQNQRAKVVERISILEKEKRGLEAENESLNTELSTLKRTSEDILKKKSTLNSQIHNAYEKFLTISNDRKKLSEAVMEQFRYPQAVSGEFANALVDFKQSLDKLKLPENSAREFFEELAMADKCICGTDLTDDLRAHIKAGAQDYLGGDEQILINHIKGEITKHIGNESQVASIKFSDDAASLKKLLKQEGLAKQDYDRLKEDAGKEDPDFAAKEKRRKEIEAQIIKNNERLSDFSEGAPSKDINTSLNLGHLRKRLTDLEKEISEISGTVELKKKIDILREILRSSQADARKRINADIARASNVRITELMPDNRIKIDKIDNCLHLLGQSSGSAGENLSVAYSFLSSLFHRSDFDLPFVVDSPVIPLDRSVRKNLSRIVAHLGHQFIGFTISTEQDFVNFVKNSGKHEIHFLTLFRNRFQAEAERARSFPAMQETADGILVKGYDFFSSFQYETEDEISEEVG